MADVQAVLTPVAVVTTAVTVQVNKINYYNATSGALAPPLPALAGQSVGANATVIKWEGDTTTNAVTVTCAGADTFYGGATTDALNASGLVRTYQVISVAGTKYWAKLDGWGGGSSGTYTKPGTGIPVADLDPAVLADVSHILLFSAGWATRPPDTRPAEFRGGSAATNAPPSSNLRVGDLWAPATA